MKKVKNFLKSGFEKVKKSKYKHIAGFMAFVMVFGMFGGFGGVAHKAASSTNGMYDDMYGVQADLYKAYSNSPFDVISDAVDSAVSAMGVGASKSESINSSYAPSYAPEAPMEDAVVSESDYYKYYNCFR